ncbi:hypothetical protein CMK19_00575 [Candidatus Poribacteria bacterium]|nr:hypothetical protein [Candidatus Poribacteria bacterium]
MAILNCKSGFSFSVQASHGHYCLPREDNPEGGYTHYEVGYPSEGERLLLPYKEMECDIQFPPTKSVYPFVPKCVIKSIIEKHDGLIDSNHNNWELGSEDFWVQEGIRFRIRERVRNVRLLAEAQQEPRLLEGHDDGGIGIACAQAIDSSDVVIPMERDDKLEMFIESISNMLEEETL